jgi:hypothetical protein
MSKIYMFLLLSLVLCSMAPVQAASGRGNPGASEAVEQARDITGKVTADDGSGLPGVHVLIEGTSLGTVTDSDGNYTINVPSDESVLVFSFIGYATQRASVGSLSVVNITLIADITSLDEVVVTGYKPISHALMMLL